MVVISLRMSSMRTDLTLYRDTKSGQNISKCSHDRRLSGLEVDSVVGKRFGQVAFSCSLAPQALDEGRERKAGIRIVQKDASLLAQLSHSIEDDGLEQGFLGGEMPVSTVPSGRTICQSALAPGSNVPRSSGPLNVPPVNGTIRR